MSSIIPRLIGLSCIGKEADCKPKSKPASHALWFSLQAPAHISVLTSLSDWLRPGSTR